MPYSPNWSRSDVNQYKAIKRQAVSDGLPEDEAQAATVMAKLVAAGLTPQAASKVAHGQLLLAPGVWVVVNP